MIYKKKKNLQGMHVYLQALNETAAWSKAGMLNNDSCVQESQLAGLNHYLHRCTPDIFIFLYKNPELVSDQKFSCSSTYSAVRGCFKV